MTLPVRRRTRGRGSQTNHQLQYHQNGEKIMAPDALLIIGLAIYGIIFSALVGVGVMAIRSIFSKEGRR